MDGQPFFVINQAVGPGIDQSHRTGHCAPTGATHPPSHPASKTHPLSHRFVLVFDREGYSPDFLLRMKRLRIACQTYHKFPGADWAHEEFITRKVPPGIRSRRGYEIG